MPHCEIREKHLSRSVTSLGYKWPRNDQKIEIVWRREKYIVGENNIFQMTRMRVMKNTCILIDGLFLKFFFILNYKKSVKTEHSKHISKYSHSLQLKFYKKFHFGQVKFE